jgi:hypothetical protein
LRIGARACAFTLGVALCADQMGMTGMPGQKLGRQPFDRSHDYDT